MQHKNLLVVSLLLLVAVLIGVTVIEPATNAFEWLSVFTPMIVITGFFVFLVSVSLFVFVIICNLDKRNSVAIRNSHPHYYKTVFAYRDVQLKKLFFLLFGRIYFLYLR